MGEKNVDESMDENVGAAVKKTALKAMKKKQLPCSRKKTNRVSIFSPWRMRMVSVNPYPSRKRRLIEEDSWFSVQKLRLGIGGFWGPNRKNKLS